MLTRRGWALAGVTAFSFVMATGYGARSLNAVMVPALLALVAAVVQVRRADRPSVSRRVPADGFVGETRTVALDAETRTAIAAVVTDRTAAALGAGVVRRETTLGGTVTYEVTLGRRGEHELGPATVTVTDVLGLAERSFEYRGTDTLLAYPEVRDLTAGGVLALGVDAFADDREEFDTLREYVRGDSLRDVHWKSSAGTPGADLLVREYESDEEPDAFDIVAEADRGRADEMATAAASVALALLDADVPVRVAAPNGTVDAGRGEGQRTAVLALLARAGAGSVPSERRGAADVHVRATGDEGATVEFQDRRVAFDDLARDAAPRDGGRAAPAGTGVVP
ncbi:DUF58 domain-containing protein [Halostella sp. JP-L12]|uniref:DUF58 domain-containing protein n=1 Tax=Halostella TaxID=1843185 RepID=UPI0013CED43E|nr:MULTISPECIES: DUF58 domain-containing protein [Halostella]NHN48142.1 DUF58 domain-containing protein [Halostella sp. JP-L12]